MKENPSRIISKTPKRQVYLRKEEMGGLTVERQLEMNLVEGRMIATSRKGVNLVFGSNHDEISPVELLVSGIAGCSFGVLKIILENRKITYGGIHVNVRYEMADEKPNPVKQVWIEYAIKNPTTDIETLGRILEQVIKSCTVIQSVKAAIDVHEKITIVP